MSRYVSLRKNRRGRVQAVYDVGQNNAVKCVAVSGDISASTIILDFNKAIQSLPSWAAGMLTISNNGVDRADTGWSQTGDNQITVTTAATMVVGVILVTFLSPSSAITFIGGGIVAGDVAGGGVVA